MNTIELQGLCKNYGNGKCAVQDLHLRIEKGDFFGLIGPNGAGKTTTIGIISSLIRKTAGKVIVFGNDLDLRPLKVKRLIGLVPQEYNFSQFDGPLDILMTQAGYYGLDSRKAEQNSVDCLKKLGLWDMRAQESRCLSGGEKRRLLLARALVHEPPLLILDEPTAGIDVEARRMIWELLRELNVQGTTILLTTHYLEEAEALCKTLAIMDQGKLLRHSTVDALLQTINIQTFILYFDRVVPPKAFERFEYRQLEPTVLEVNISEKQSINDLILESSRQELSILKMRHKSNRLEELFLHLTNKNHQK